MRWQSCIIIIQGLDEALPELRGGAGTGSPYISRKVYLPRRSEVQEMQPSRGAGPMVPVPFRQKEPLSPLRKFPRRKAARHRSHRSDVQEPAQLFSEILRSQPPLVPF